jgi:putative ABC transport system permease protein
MLTAAAITLGVGFLTGTLVYSDTARAGFFDDFARQGAGVDVAVNPPDSGNYPRDATLSAANLSTVRGLPGVAAADGRVVAGLALLDRSGRAVTNDLHIGYAVSVPDPTMPPMHLVTGTVPTATGSAALDRPTAARLNLTVGDTITVLDPAGTRQTLRLVGVADYGTGLIFSGDSVVMLTGADLARLTTSAGYHVLTAYPFVSLTDKADRREEVIAGLDRRVIEFDALAGVSALLATLGIWDTLALSVLERSNESGLLRALGLSPRPHTHTGRLCRRRGHRRRVRVPRAGAHPYRDPLSRMRSLRGSLRSLLAH